MAKGKVLNRKSYARNPYVRFDVGEVTSASTPKLGSGLYTQFLKVILAIVALYNIFLAPHLSFAEDWPTYLSCRSLNKGSFSYSSYIYSSYIAAGGVGDAHDYQPCVISSNDDYWIWPSVQENGYDGESCITVPSFCPYQVDGSTRSVPVRSFSASYFSDSRLKKIIISDGIMAVSICNVYSLEELELSDAVQRIWLVGCSNLKKVKMSANLKIFDSNGGYGGCSSLHDIELPNTLVEIGQLAFKEYGLKDIYVPPSVQYASQGLFLRCNQLTNAVFNASTYLHSATFSGCTSLKTITLGDEVKGICKTHWMPTSSSYQEWTQSPFSGCTALETVMFGRQIGGVLRLKLFEGCRNLKELKCKGRVSGFDKYDFYNCNSLTNIESATAITSVGEYALYNCQKLSNRVFDTSKCKTFGANACARCYAFNGTLDLTGAISIGDYAFSECTNIKELDYRNKMTTIPQYGFSSCTSLTNITLSANLKSIGNYAFCRCSQLNNIIIPENVTHIGTNSFQNCSSLKNVMFNGTPPSANSAFTFVAANAHGYYLPKHKDKWEAVIDANGYWNGLKMQMREPLPLPPLTLTAESADWSSGSITLKCEDPDTSGESHRYSLEYKNESGVWEEVDDAKNVAATKGQDANGQGVWVAKLTDEAFWSRLGGLPPVEYRVKDENGRVSTGCVTRNRHGLYVGVGEYEDGEKRGLPSLPFAPSDASKFKGIAEKHAKFSGRPVYANHDATIEAVDAALGDLVDCSQSGDICLFYITTHGGYDGKDGLICLYDGDYTHSALTEKVSRMADKGIAFIAVVGTCHAEAMLQMDFPNAAVVAAATMETSSTATFDEIFMYDGWDDCCAAPGPTMTFENLADYAIEKYNSLFGGIDFLDEDAEECYPYRMSATKNDVGGLLGKIVARTDCTSDFDIATKPSVVSGFSATTNDSEKISVSWNAVQGAERYYLFYGRLGNPQFLGYKVIEIDDGTSCAFGIDKDWVKETSKAAPARFMVKAYNVAGASPVATANGWRYREFSIIFYTIDHERVDWDEPSFNRYKDDEVVKCVEYGDEYILKCLPKAKKPGYYLKGWYDLNDNEAVAGLTLNSDAMYHAEWREIAMPQIWLDEHVDIVEYSGGDLATAAAMTAANGTRTVDECYRLGIDPEDPEDDLKIAEFKMKDGKPEITLNHTKDGSGNSFEDRVKILGKAELTDAEWQEVPPEGNPAHRFFKVGVEMP